MIAENKIAKSNIRGKQDSAGGNRYALDILKKGVWLYFFLLIFEGALRKWILPGLSEVLLIVRDPLVMILLFYAWYNHLLKPNIYALVVFVIGVISIFTAIFLGHGNLFVSLYGARILILHFPFIFLIGSVFNRDDVVKLGKVVLWISIPMVILIGLQFYSPQSAWVNRTVGGGFGGGFSGASGYFRPPGTFSFTNGTTLFFSMTGAFVFSFWLKPNGINKIILLAATAGLVMAIPFSISRGLTFTLVVMVLFVLMSVSQKPKYLVQIFMAGIGICVAFVLLSKTDFFQTAIGVLGQRFENAGASEGGVEGTLVNRYLGGMIHAISSSAERPFFGEGIGMGTNAGGAILTSSRGFLISEGEWGRLIGEMGALFGITTIFIRLAISFKLSLKSYFRLATGDVLPWMLLSFALLVFPQGQWAQPTTLGFSTLIVGILIASFNDEELKQEEKSDGLINAKT